MAAPIAEETRQRVEVVVNQARETTTGNNRDTSRVEAVVNQDRQPNTPPDQSRTAAPTPPEGNPDTTPPNSDDDATTSPTGDSGSDTSGSDDGQNETTPPTGNEGFTVDDNFNNFTLDEKIDHLKKHENELSDDQKKQLNDLESAKQKFEEHATNKVGTVKGPFDDPDYGDPEKSKFDIQQGDFIEFLMKEVVIASTAWAGDKVCGYTGLYMYRGLSGVYHGTAKGLNKYILDPASEEYHDIKEKITKSIQKTKEEVKKAEIGKDEFSPKATDDRTTKFAKEIYQQHNNLIKKNEIFENGDQLYKMVSAAIDGKLNEITINDKNGNPVDQNSPMYQMLLQVTENTKNMKNPQLAKDQVVDIIKRKSAEVAMVNTFSSSYAAAKIIELKSKDPEKFNDQKASEVYQEYLLQGRKLFYIEAGNMSRGNSKYKDMNDFLADSVEALTTARENIKKGSYIEKNSKVPENKKLTKLDNIYNGTSSEVRSQNVESLYRTAMDANAQDAQIFSMLNEASMEEAALAGQKADNDERRKPKKQKKDTNSNTPPIIEQNRGGRK